MIEEEEGQDSVTLLSPDHIEKQTKDCFFSGNRDCEKWIVKKVTPIAVASDDDNIALFSHLLALLLFAVSPFIPFWFVTTVGIFYYFWFALRIFRRFKPEKALFYAWVARSTSGRLACYVAFFVLVLASSIAGATMTRGDLQKLFIVTSIYSGLSMFVVFFAFYVRYMSERKKPSVNDANENRIRLIRLQALLNGDGTMKYLMLDIKYAKAILTFLRNVGSELLVTTVDDEDAVVNERSETLCVEFKNTDNGTFYKGEITAVVYTHIYQIRLTFLPPIATKDFTAALESYLNPK